MSKDQTPVIQHSKIIGAFFLLAFLAYGIGRFLFESGDFMIGSILIILNSLMVLMIGVLMNKTLTKLNSAIGNIYLFSRIFEAIALASLILQLNDGWSLHSDHAYFAAMIVLGLGSIPMCSVFLKHKVLPSWLALWGLIAYAIFALGFILEFFGLKYSMYFLIPGGLWELVFGLYLIFKKWNSILFVV